MCRQRTYLFLFEGNGIYIMCLHYWLQFMHKFYVHSAHTYQTANRANVNYGPMLATTSSISFCIIFSRWMAWPARSMRLARLNTRASCLVRAMAVRTVSRYCGSASCPV